MLRKIAIAAAFAILPFAAGHAQETPASSTAEPTTTTGAATGSTDSAASSTPASDAGAGIEVGATVKDKSGATVGTVKEVTAQGVVISTDKGLVQAQASGLAKVPGGYAVGLTKAEIDAAVSGGPN